MSLFSMLRRPTYSALSLAVRAVGSGGTFHRAISTVPTFTPSLIRRSFVPTQRFCTAGAAAESIGDQSLVAVLEAEIKCAEERMAPTPERPDEFPFEIVDNSGDSTILLKREFDGETIQLCVDIPNCSMPRDPDDVHDDLRYHNPGIPIVVSISKPNGQQLEFGVTGFTTELSIDTLSIKHPGDSSEDIAYDGPEFDDLDENLQIAFYKYLNERGIKDDMIDFLYDYLENKENKEYRVWLKNLKSFVEH